MRQNKDSNIPNACVDFVKLNKRLQYNLDVQSLIRNLILDNSNDKFVYDEHTNTSKINKKYLKGIKEFTVIKQLIVNSADKVGKEVIETIPFDTPFSLRIDFGCCLDNKKVCREYFINEIEYNGNLLANDTEFEVIESLGKTIIKRANSLKKNK